MARYIDLDKCVQYRTNHGGYPDTFAFPPWTEFEDVAPVIHAHWFESYWGGTGAECSNCGDVVSACDMDYQDVIHDFEYCPYCGAKMDEE